MVLSANFESLGWVGVHFSDELERHNADHAGRCQDRCDRSVELVALGLENSEVVPLKRM